MLTRELHGQLALHLLVLQRCQGLGTRVDGGAPQTQARLGWRQLGATAKDAPGASAPPGRGTEQGRCSCSCSGHAPAAWDVPRVPTGGCPGHVTTHRLQPPPCPHAWAAGCLLAPRGICCRFHPLWPPWGKAVVPATSSLSHLPPRLPQPPAAPHGQG